MSNTVERNGIKLNNEQRLALKVTYWDLREVMRKIRDLQETLDNDGVFWDITATHHQLQEITDYLEDVYDVRSL